jgi:ubiquinone/menaquinone biosynthesis C-methylase UbiE
MNPSRVQKLYHIGRAKWYDPLKRIWNALVAGKGEKALNRFLKKSIQPESSILEMGCGTALNLQKIQAHNLSFTKYEGWDFSDDMLAIAKKKFKNTPNIHFKKQDLTNIQVVYQKFDVIICTWVLSHLENPEKLVNQAQALLNKDGKMFFVFIGKPAGWFGRLIYFLSKHVFVANALNQKQIEQFKNVKSMQRFMGGIVTVVEF